MLDALQPFLPKGSANIVTEMLRDESFHLIVSRPRKTKLGDFRPPRNGETPQLTVNGNLNQYAFLITLVHEIAHLKIWNKHKNRVSPHGDEWKNLYSGLLTQFLNKGIFPPHVEVALRQHVNQPKYTTGADAKLTLALRQFDGPSDLVSLKELPIGTNFNLSGRQFVLGEKLRSRYLCVDVANGKKYRVHGLAQVAPENIAKMA